VSTPVNSTVGAEGRRERWIAVGYLLPALIVFGLFIFWPLVKSIMLSVQGTDILGNPSGYVGGVNYTRMFHDPEFLTVLWVTFAFTILTVIPSIAIALAIALLLQSRIRGVRFFRTAFALPFAFSVATASVIFGVLFNPASGVLNGMLSHVGIDKVQWLTDPDLALWSVSGATVWMQIGNNLLVLSAGLGALPEDVLEAARLDGASGLRLQRSIIMPLLTPQLFFLVVVGTIHSLQSFGQIKILTVGGPENRTTTLVYSIYEQAFANNNSNYGYASAQAMVLLLIVLIITALQFGVLERRVFYR
jgi:sn-glycerol 3-phosphate transport system permease protein